MTDAIERELTDGGPVAISLRGTEHSLAYPLYAVIAYKQKTGDSLFDPQAWPKIDLQEDPARWIACLWSGLHQQQPDGSWKAPFTVEELGGLVDFGNAGEISVAMVKALTRYMPKAKPEPTEKKTDAEPQPMKLTSEDSGEDAEFATASAAPSSSQRRRAS